MKRTLQRICNPLVKEFLRIANPQERSVANQQEQTAGAINSEKRRRKNLDEG
jgi:hypothetical protein